MAAKRRKTSVNAVACRCDTRAYDQCDQGCHNDPFLILVESVHPPVGTSEREQNGTRYGGYQNSPLPEVSDCIDIVIYQEENKYTLHIEFPCTLATRHS